MFKEPTSTADEDTSTTLIRVKPIAIQDEKDGENGSQATVAGGTTLFVKNLFYDS